MGNNEVEKFEHKGLRVVIVYDQNPENPRNWCNLGRLVGWYRRYAIGDSHEYRDPDAFLYSLLDAKAQARMDRLDAKTDVTPGQYQAKLQAEVEKTGVLLPVYMYDHSGVALSVNPFSCPWDSGQVGWAYVSFAKLREDNGWRVINAKRFEHAKQCLIDEVETYGAYMNGEVYGYVIEQVTLDDEGDEVDCQELDSCFGYYGMDCVKEAALEAADGCANRRGIGQS